MPFCCNCGKPVRTTDQFCAVCGARQAHVPPPPADVLDSISPRTASLLCYIPVLGWIGSVIVLASSRYRQDRTVRFHAFQGLYLFVAFLILDLFLPQFSRIMPHPGIPANFFLSIGKFLLYCTWIFMLIKTSQGLVYRLPVLGELAERSVAEQVG